MHHYFFYASPDQINGSTATLTGDDFRHCIQVLRKKIGDKVSLIDGKGNIFHTSIQEITKTSCGCRILSRENQQRALKTAIFLGFGLVKIKALELIIRDATALGVSGIVPLLTKHSVTQSVNAERIHKIAIESIKQSGNYYLPEIEKPQSISEWLNGLAPDTIKILCDQESKKKLNELLAGGDPTKSIAVLVGPEGGLHDAEIKLALDTGFLAVNLNPFRLRTELAAAAAISSICSLIN
ncbi:MAG: RsmE family RNA methyltransferase [Candidatus Marinimicrobia bacterium]|nr:RsmE family RNA methyltransferase [Candidatus Neomarinimicrobiota bacterium]